MKSLLRPLALFLGLLLLAFACKTKQQTATSSRPNNPDFGEAKKTEAELPTRTLEANTIALNELNFELPEIPREFRGVWIATVVNIDWPESGSDSYEKQKADYLKILDHYKELNFNAVIVQVRTAGDAFYPSNLAPWSRYLTGKEGKAPETNENPLTWMINAAHNRGFEFHALAQSLSGHFLT